MKRYVVTHEHEYGQTTHLVATAQPERFEAAFDNGRHDYMNDSEFSPDLRTLLDALKIDFEPWKNEFLDFDGAPDAIVVSF